MEAKRVLLPVNGEDSDEESLWLACNLVRGSKGKIYVLYVIEVSRQFPLDADVSSETVRGEEVLQRMEKLGKEYQVNVDAEILQAREAGPAVVQEAVEREVETIVVGVPYKRRYGVFSLGTTVPFILKNSPCPVLLWRGETRSKDVHPSPLKSE
jgi:nucleotide-binding universal stress UspA family protein